MKIVVIGASGTVGRAVAEELSRQHQVIRVGRTQGDLQVDITSQPSVEALFEKSRPGRCDCLGYRQSVLWPAGVHDGPGFQPGPAGQTAGANPPGANRAALSQ